MGQKGHGEAARRWVSLHSTARRRRELAARRETAEALQRRNRELTLLNRAGQALTSTLDLQEVLTIVLEEVRQLLGIVAASVWLIDPETGELVCQQATGSQSERVRGWRLPVGQGLVGWAALTGENVIVADTQVDSRHYKGVDQSTGLELRSILSLPLRSKHGIIGVLQVVDSAVGRFDAVTVALLEPLAVSAAIAVENARLYTQMQEELLRRQQAEVALRASERRFRALVEHGSDIILVVDRQRRLVYASPSVEHLLGYPPGEEAGKDVFTFLTPESVPKANLDLAVVAQHPELPHTVEVEVWHRDGGRRVLEGIAQNRLDDPDVGGVIINLHDITPHRRSEAALSRARDFYLLLLDKFPIPVWRSGADAKFNYFNQAWLDFTGRSLADARGDGWIEDVHPDEQQRCLEVYLEAFHTRRPFEWEFRLRRHDGEYRWMLAMGRPFTDLDGEFAGYLGMAYDLTERREAEAALQRQALIFENLYDAIIVTDLQGRILDWNPAATLLYGYAKEELLGQPVELLYHPDSRLVPLAGPAEGGPCATRQVGELTFVRKDGTVGISETMVLPLCVNGEQVAFIRVNRDITQRKQTEAELHRAVAELQQTNARLQEANRVKELLTDVISHDSGTPLSVILGYTDLLLLRPPRGMAPEVITTIRDNALQLQQLIRDALLYVRVNSTGVFPYEPRDLNVLLHQVVTRFTPLFEAAQIKVDYRAKGEKIAPLNPLIEQVFANLLSNAIKYAASGKRLEIDILERPGSYCIYIKDWGTGISDANKERVFSRLARISKVGIQGTGLGLAIVKEIVTLHHGRVWIEDNPEGGAIFWVELPASAPAAEAAGG